MPPDRAFPIVFNMIEPIAGFDHRPAVAANGIGEANTVGGAAITDLLLFVGGREPVAMNGKDFDRFGDVLEMLAPEVTVAECEFLLHLVIGLTRNANAATV